MGPRRSTKRCANGNSFSTHASYFSFLFLVSDWLSVLYAPSTKVLGVAPDNGFAKVHYGFILKSENKIAESIPYLKVSTHIFLFVCTCGAFSVCLTNVMGTVLHMVKETTFTL